MTILTLYFDGACEPTNPGGISTGGWLIKDSSGVTIASDSLYICEGEGSTNNVAEYGALLAGVKAAVKLLPEGDQLVIRGDSKLVVNQIAMRWKCNKDHLRRLRDECISTLYGVRWKSEWIPREQNSEADTLSKSLYEERTGQIAPDRRRWRRVWVYR